ncbi:MAG TPA: M20/M25/M40 family metallo-hydrolase [Micromonosporaceae bacterium]
MELEHLLSAAARLIAVRSTAADPDALRRALDVVVDLVGPGFVVERFSSGGKPSALIYRDRPRPRFRVILNAHLDVVAGDAVQFSARTEGARLYGRGAHDMKVAALVLAQVFRDLAGELTYPIALQLVTDEEVGGRDGTGHQVALGVTGEFVIIGEQSGLRVVTESKGFVQARLHAVGRAAHAAYPWLGDNALLRLTRSIDRLLVRYPVATSETWSTTVNVARIETGNQTVNLVPADAEAWLDIRYPAGDTDFHGGTPDGIAGYLLEFCEPGVAVHIEQTAPPHRADPDCREVRLLRSAAGRVGFSGDLLRKHGAADGRFYSERGINAVIFGPGGTGQHSTDEYVDIETIVPYYRALADFLRHLS